MRVATKIATGSALLVLLLLGALTYNVRLIERAAAMANDLLQSQFAASEATFSLLRRLDSLDVLLGKFLLVNRPDHPAHARAPEVEDGLLDEMEAFETTLEELEALQLSKGEESAVALLRDQWQHFVSYCQKVVRRRGEQPSPAPEAIGEVLPSLLQDLKAQANLVYQATGAEVRSDARRTQAASRKVRRLAWAVTGLALVVCLVIIVLTVRSINGPLKRLVAANRAVAAGRFETRLDPARGGDFSRLADSFNAMAERLSELEAMKRDFVAHVSHELRNPLVAMQETNRLLLDELAGPLTDKQRRMLLLNLDSARRLSAMISNLLDLSSLEAGVMTYELRQVDFVELLHSVAAEFEGRLGERGLELHLDLPAEPLLALGDRDRVIQLLENLLDNALKFSPEGGRIEVSLRLLAKLPKGLPAALAHRLANGTLGRAFVLLAVADTGPGVPDLQKELIFRKFHQVSGRSRARGSGVGLGLAICAEIVAAHDGAVWVSDRRGGGSVFSVLLPGPLRTDPAVESRLRLPLLKQQEAAS
ncbi:MAG TPA: ATP-binding protein [Thermoanaerobaculia bacterium]|nr:ATP-binding protein [Thermoanaerobaculia bacterium]